MPPVEELDVVKKRKANLEEALEPEPDAFVALTPRESSKTKKSRTDEKADVPEPEFTKAEHIPLTTHTDAFGNDPVPISWGHPDPAIRAPVICTVRHHSQRNAIGAHQGSYCIYTGLAVAAKKLDPDYLPDLKLTSPVFKIGPHPSWSDPKKIAALDPYGHMV
eukprot:CAMPEP_0176169950 /NCGR_PEP_ID=MMETSP0120_2-20121206/87007_1 /TAXON_ID=160619 /ORGANISM="Kryptoperidinium foliaceum, Strain CCMP 1326" /LENGTH=162 /DNA_ID=CAMNT_0017507747 /DNA_START=63 /DNA_END=547 /DNA_ORIENTATION=-